MADPPYDPASDSKGGRVGLALNPGQTVMEYAIERVLGGGGFGITYLARDLNLGLSIALKEYLPAELAMRSADGKVRSLGEAAESQFSWGLERFIDEARALATFSHPNIVRVLRYFTTNGTAYIVMEYQSGSSLKQWMPRHQPISRTDLLRLVLPLLDGLEKVHQAGFLHRDIKPDNIFVREDGSPTLIDFGAARRTTLGPELTNIISPGFAPFEQYHSKGNQGPWTDLYSLAGVMYWLVSGNKPAESISRFKHDDMIPAVQSDPHNLIGEPILSAIDWALTLDEEKRPQSAREFRARLVGDSGVRDVTQLQGVDFTIALGKSGQQAGFNPSQTMLNSVVGNFVCSVLFTDMVGYTKSSLSEQYELKSLFNQLMTSKLARHPESTRITLDTGDGAAICFMGDPEDVLHTALDIRRTLDARHRLHVRMGLHVGPVRVLNDLNGRGSVVGDGINAAQRVMSFADERSLLVSRAFYDIVACLSDDGEKAFRYVGGQQDKHGRVHELYEVVLEDPLDLPFERTQLSGIVDFEMPAAIDPQVVAGIEHELTHHIGPLAPVLMRKALGRANDAAQLRELLSQTIADPGHREAFRQGISPRPDEQSGTRRTRSSEQPSSHPSTRRVSGDASLPPSRLVNSRSGIPNSASHSQTSTEMWLPEETVAIVEAQLAHHVGPLARVLVKKEMRKTANFQRLAEALALHVDDPQKRAQFLKALSSMRIPGG